MDEGFVEWVNETLRLVSIRNRDASSYCVVRLLGRHTPPSGQWVRGRWGDEGAGFVVSEGGETAAVAVIRPVCSRSEAAQWVDRTA